MCCQIDDVGKHFRCKHLSFCFFESRPLRGELNPDSKWPKYSIKLIFFNLVSWIYHHKKACRQWFNI
jgi:hypothetical protein